jgi:tetratricopeptide (TPR) repeat protein
MEWLQPFFDVFWAFIERLYGSPIAAWLKNALQWVVVIGSAITILYRLVRWLFGDRPATKDDIERLKAELLQRLPPQPEGALGEGADAVIEKDLDKAVETLLAAGRADALRDITGEAADAVIDQLIAQREATRERVARDEADLYRQKGALAFLHDTDKALRAYAKATELDPHDPDGWNELGALQLRVGELDAAIASFKRVLALGQRTADLSVLAAATGNLALVYSRRGDVDQAEAMYRKSLALLEQLGRKEGMAATYGNLGIFYDRCGDLDRAEAMYNKALALDEQLGRKEGMAIRYGNLGVLYKTRGDLDRAEALHRDSLALYKQMGHKQGMAANYGNLGLIYQLRGDLDQAEAMHRESLDLDKRIGHKHGMAATFGNLGNIYVKRGDLAQACSYWRIARDLFAEIGLHGEVEQYDRALRSANCPAS